MADIISTLELWSFLGILKYLGKFSLATVQLCEPLRKLMSLRSIWKVEQNIPILLWHKKSTHQKGCNHGILLGKGQLTYRHMHYCGSWTVLLQVTDGMWFSGNEASDNAALHLIGTYKQNLDQSWNPVQQHWQRSTRHTAWPRKFHHYCFACEISMVMDQ